MQLITSPDGTTLAVWRSGEGPPLLLVHGATADHTTTWRFVRANLERRFTVYAMDRRGRGQSGDAPSYELEREAEDVAAIVDTIARSTGGPVAVFGHSHGGLCALEAALLTPNLGHLILYEAIPLRGADDVVPGVTARLEASLDAGDVEGVLLGLLRNIVEMPEAEIALMRAQEEAWRVRLSNVRTTPRELRAYERYVFAAERFVEMKTPTLFMVGSDSPPRELANAEGVAQALPSARVAVLEGQQHIAMHTDPEGFVATVVGFVLE